jgi:CRP-like cAMP-binding protein
MTAVEKVRLEREIMLRSAFPTMAESAYARFIEVMEPIEVEAGQVLFSKGDTSDHVYFLTEGRVVMEAPGEKPWVFEPVSVIGVIDATLERPRKRDARAIEASSLFVVVSSVWFDIIEDDPQVARGAIRNFATSLHPRWRALAAQPSRRSAPPAAAAPRSLAHYDKLIVLRQAEFVKRAGMQALVSLATVAESTWVAAGEPVFNPGKEHDYLCVVASGAVELSQGDEFRTLQGAGELLGGPGALARAMAEYGARAITDVALVRIAEQDFYDRAEEHPRLTRAALAYLVSELEAVGPWDPPAE